MNTHQDRLLPCFLRPFAARRPLDRFSTDC